MKKKKPSNRQDVPLQKREFVNDPLVPARATLKRKFRRFYRDNKLVSYTLLGVFAFLAFMVWMLVFEEVETRVEVEQVNRYWLNDEVNVERFQNEVMLHRFGADNVDYLQSIRVSGQMQLSGNTKEFYLLKKRPGQAYMKIELEDGMSMTVGVTSDDVWRRLEIPDRMPIIQIVEGEEAEGYQALGEFFTPFLHQVILRDSEVYSVGLSEDLGFQTVKVEFQNIFKDCRSTVYLDVDDLVELQRLDFFENGKIGRVEFSDYQTFGDMQFAMKTEFYKDDVLVQLVELDKVTLNPGVLSELFIKPNK